jgi:hypothetical protein
VKRENSSYQLREIIIISDTTVQAEPASHAHVHLTTDRKTWKGEVIKSVKKKGRV